MTETGWQVIGRIAKARRERLGLNQEDLAAYGGPKVATVGKFERAAQDRFPLRTQHQMEKALGWRRTTIEQVVGSIDEDRLAAADWEHDLVEDDIPDMSVADARIPGLEIGDETSPEFGRHMRALSAVLQMVPDDLQEHAVRLAARTMIDAIINTDQLELAVEIQPKIESRLRLSEGSDTTGDSIAAYEEVTSIEGEQEESENS